MSRQDAEQLPLADYDQLPVGVLESRIRALTAEQLERLLRYETDHADRPPVREILRARLDQLAAGATPTDGGGDAGWPPSPDQEARGGSPVSPATEERIHPPPHGTPDQPGKPKADRP